MRSLRSLITNVRQAVRVRRLCDSEKKIEINFCWGRLWCKEMHTTLWRGLAESAFFPKNLSMESGGRFFISAFGRNVASVGMEMFCYLIYLMKKFYKFYISYSTFAEFLYLGFYILISSPRPLYYILIFRFPRVYTVWSITAFNRSKVSTDCTVCFLL
jgi:hypothetical protein